MCSSKSNKPNMTTPKIAQINGRPVLQPTSNQVPNLERRNSLKKTTSPKSPTLKHAPLPLPTSTTNTTSNVKTNKSYSLLSPPISPKLKSPRPPAVKRGNDPNELNSSAEKVMTPRCTTTKLVNSVKKPKSTTTTNGGAGVGAAVVLPSYDTTALIVDAPGTIAAARREQVANLQEQRKMRIAHYGRTKSAKFEGKVNGLDSSVTGVVVVVAGKEKRCSFITPNSDPIYVSYHDEEWGVPVHDDRLLLELLVLTAAQVGSDWTSVLKKRQEFREAFSGFDPEVIAKFTEKKITTISTEYGLDISQVRGVFDNSTRILEVKKAFGSFDKYLWGFVNHKPITTQYKLCNKIPVKTSKSETISKDMVRRGFKKVGPTVIHSFMQAAGLTNDHLITCPRHFQCIALASQPPTVAPAL
ncbi:hypothetical protein ACOSP7_013415 [Xanthoceras sorbifolium]|uniref:DNA-3-methyladenine glycosylase I n=1 Tax=Xanthoceras sorbifolium TaxID=99658 RepID=A0ABQ8HZG4_9ROSI|nr:hypothetical protein JRO89_XS06G0258500 [Xanthoceras sorbifolium]